MARNFVSASSQSLDAVNAFLTSAPYTLAGWFKNNVTGNQAIVGISQNAGAGTYSVLRTSGASVVFEEFDGVANPTATSTGSATSGTWTHAAAVVASSSSRVCYRDGGNSGSDATAITYASINRIGIGALMRGGSTTYFHNGDICEVGVWSVALDAAEILALSKGVCPLLIRPQSLVAYYPLFGNASPEPDRWNANRDLTLTNTPVKSDHTRVYYAANTLLQGVAARIVNQAVSGSITPTGIVVKRTNKNMAGTVTPAGAVTPAHLIRFLRYSRSLIVSGFKRFSRQVQ